MHYLNISFTHRNSTLEIREKLSYPDDENKRGCLTKLLGSDAISEAMLISTCNRMEVFCHCSDVPAATMHILEMLEKRSSISIEELEGRADIFDDSSAIHHLFSVAASLDSMVIGETQIVGQLKDAFRFAYDNKFCGKKTASAMKSAFKCAAKVRNATDISSKPVSMASVAVNQLKSLVEDISSKKALIIGVGEMSEITAKHLVNAGADVYIMNRTKHKAEALAKKCATKVIDFSELPSAVNEFEILYTATSAPEPIITDEIIEARDFDRYWFDLALPRDIHYNKGERINLFVIDDLKMIVDENVSSRELASRAAHGVIGRAIVEFFEVGTQDLEPLIKEIYTRADAAALEETQRAIKAGYIPKEYEEEARKMCEQALKRFLHEFTVNMRSATEDKHTELISGAMASMMKEKV
ncbi:glutamyl-tRNA reductase [Sulfurimonas sp. SAG-AH-194-C21]|nr:glutamyl-tRNA reductase [Sulfurimonas sp. SAG-AH-194-C21]MDF1884437.1 glutamyl-tRNA reductase [Sulfurimonas sp. SAG-AH-194-C21]